MGGTLIAVVAVAEPQVERQPTFRSAIDYVEIPVRVLDARGQLVRGLTQSEFQILEDGQSQTISTFNEMDIPFVRADRVVRRRDWASDEAIASNDPQAVDGRVYVFVVDNQSMTAAGALRTRHVVRRFIRDGVAANDVAAIVLTGSGRGQPFTRNTRLLDAAIDRLMSDADPTGSSVDRVMRTIADTAASMGAIRGRRKALVLITPSPICSLVNLDANVFSNCTEGTRHALRMAVQSDVSIYTIDPLGAVPSHGAPAEAADAPVQRPAAIIRGPFDAARYLAEESGGFAVVNSNSLDAGFARVVAENSSYYLVGYYSTNKADGKPRRNEVKVARPGVRVIHRAGYLAPVARADVKVGANHVPTATAVDEQLQQLADNPLPAGGIPLLVAAAPFASSDSVSSVAVVVEIPAGPLKETGDRAAGERSRVKLSIGFYDPDGKSVGGAEPLLDLSDAAADVLRSVSWIAVPPGAYRLWVGAVQSPAGISGSAMTDIQIPDFQQPRLALSGVTISNGASAMANRNFAAGSEMFLYGEIYDRRPVPAPVRATVTIRKDADVVYHAPFERISNTAGHQAYIPLKHLRPGAYSATVEAVSNAAARTVVTRSFAFTVSAQ